MWSTSAVRSQTVAWAIEGGLWLSVYEGEVWYGVEEPEDVLRLEASLRVRPERAPAPRRL